MIYDRFGNRVILEQYDPDKQLVFVRYDSGELGMVARGYLRADGGLPEIERELQKLRGTANVDEVKRLVAAYLAGKLPGDVEVTVVPLERSHSGGWIPQVDTLAVPVYEGGQLKEELIKMGSLPTSQGTVWAGYGPKTKRLLIGDPEKIKWPEMPDQATQFSDLVAWFTRKLARVYSIALSDEVEFGEDSIERLKLVYGRLVEETENPRTYKVKARAELLGKLLNLMEYIERGGDSPLDNWFG